MIGIVTVGATTAEMLDEMLSRALFAAVILVPPAGANGVDRAAGGATMAAAVKVVQRHGAAALLLDDWALAKRLAADGVHLSARDDAVAAYRQARVVLGPDANIGVDAGGSRHIAMELGEAGADYIAFSLRPKSADRAAAVIERDELVAWWAEVFEVPCVACDVCDAEEGGRLADAGADFVAYRIDAESQVA